MSSELDQARTIRNICISIYLLGIMAAIGLWVYVIILEHHDAEHVLFVLLAGGLIVGNLSSFLAFKIKCPKCYGHFFSKSNKYFGVNALSSRCRHCGLRL